MKYLTWKQVSTIIYFEFFEGIGLLIYYTLRTVSIKKDNACHWSSQ